MDNLYKGKIIPAANGKGMELNCNNSLCYGISCFDCINFPTTDVSIIKHEYLTEVNRDELISEGIERVSNVRDD